MQRYIDRHLAGELKAPLSPALSRGMVRCPFQDYFFGKI